MSTSAASLNAAAYEALKARIVRGDLRPGAPLSERALCDELAVSRTPLREALKRLANEGLVEISQTRRARVARVSVDEVVNLLAVMAVLEGLSGEQACEKASDADLDELARLQNEMESAYARTDHAAYFALNQQIHLSILRMADNGPLAEYFHNLNARLRHVRERLTPTPERWRQAVDEHAEMLALLRRRDGKRLRPLMEAHLRSKTDAYVAAMLNEGLVSMRRAA